MARAVVERAFRARLLADPADALGDYGLPASQRYAVDGMRANSLTELAARMLRLAASAWGPGFDGVALESDSL
ncbi:MAG TPA: hypothetical protein VKQ30_08050 [Ktedonobacterales bacterium]|nr:hypothetical protein [Ktedonobacterales bacterium]